MNYYNRAKFSARQLFPFNGLQKLLEMCVVLNNQKYIFYIFFFNHILLLWYGQINKSFKATRKEWGLWCWHHWPKQHKCNMTIIAFWMSKAAIQNHIIKQTFEGNSPPWILRLVTFTVTKKKLKNKSENDLQCFGNFSRKYFWPIMLLFHQNTLHSGGRPSSWPGEIKCKLTNWKPTLLHCSTFP